MTARRTSALSWLMVVVLFAAIQLVVNACSGDDAEDAATSGEDAGDSAPAAVPSGRPDLLSEWGQIAAVDGRIELADGVTPYTLASPLFSDYAQKLRTVRLPEGSDAAAYDPDNVFDFPVGTVITKTFYYPVESGESGDIGRVLREAPSDQGLAAPLDLSSVRLVETRVLVRRADGWDAMPYVWNDAETEATLQRIGDLVPLTLVDGGTETPFVYTVPDENQCAACHATNHTTGEIQPIGPKARHLNIDVDLGEGSTSQLALWQEIGLLESAAQSSDFPAIAVWDDEASPLEDRARAYLDINCAHCHNSAGAADTSGLLLEASAEVGREFGVCKQPVAAGSGTGGRPVGISPGSPEESIFVFRMASTEPDQMMPELGRSLAHDEGVDLITQWIASLEGSC